MSCPSCHAEVSEQDRFCRSCGGRLAGTDTVRPGGVATRPPVRRSRRGPRLALIVLVNLALAAGSAVAVYAVLARRAPQSGTVSLGTPRLVVLSAPSPTTTPPPAPAKRGHISRSVRTRHPRPTPAPSTPAESPSPARAPPAAPPAPAAAPTPPPNKSTGVATRPEEKEEPKQPAAKPDPSKAGPETAEDAIDRYRAGLNADSVRMVVRHHLPQVRACYDRALKQKADLAGIVEIRFTISEQGQATSSSVYRNTTGHEGLGKCLAVIIRRWRYPRPVGGAVEFVYPFVFSTGE